MVLIKQYTNITFYITPNTFYSNLFFPPELIWFPSRDPSGESKLDWSSKVYTEFAQAKKYCQQKTPEVILRGFEHN